MQTFVACPSLCQGVCECSGLLAYFMVPAIRGYGDPKFGTCHSCDQPLYEVEDSAVDEARARGYLHTDTEPCACGKPNKVCGATDETERARLSAKEDGDGSQ